MKPCRFFIFLAFIVFLASGSSTMTHFNKGGKPKFQINPSLMPSTAIDHDDQQLFTMYPFIPGPSILATILLLYLFYRSTRRLNKTMREEEIEEMTNIQNNNAFSETSAYAISFF